MATLYVRRSGRLSDQKKPNKGDDEEEVIDLTIKDWDGAGDGVDSMTNGEAKTSDTWQEGVGKEIDNIEKGMGKEKIIACKTEERKAERVMRKQKFRALVEKCKKVVHKGRLAELVRNSKKESEKGNSVAVKWKMAEKTIKGKMKNLHDGTEHIRDKPEEALDGESTDDDFVASKKIKMNKVVGIKIKPSSTTATNGKCIADPKNSNMKEKVAKDKVERVNRVHSRIPPINLFLVMTQLSVRQKQAVRDIGFGKHIDFKIKDIPTHLAYWLLDHFDEEACCLNINGKEIEITRELVTDVLGVPLEDLMPHIKWCTSDVLATLEKDKFPNDDGDDPAMNQESEDEGLDEEHGMKKFVSAFLEKAVELAELAGDVLDEGLSLHPDDVGFMELKELRDQMFATRTFSQKPCKYQEPTDQTYDNCHTPWNGRTQHEDVVEDGDELPFTQLCIELSDRVCTEFCRTNEPQDVPEFKTLDQPKRLNFDDGEELGIKIASGAIDMFTYVLNVAERSKNKQTAPRLFCHTAMLTSDMLKWEHKTALLMFNENMELVLGSSQYKRLDAVELVFFPIISGSHIFITCMNLKYNRVEYGITSFQWRQIHMLDTTFQLYAGTHPIKRA
ncbi:hypothetical protein Tco_0911668 [Tanacetum coccineum]|uniref:Ubiquitin-like protease family profile domain-containing protein n=1 Tax=Tanacetum coccineum TaxID=301880 RepID=A0ABQ5CZL5_9ASTR